MSLLVKWDLSDVCSNEILKFSKSIARDDVVLPTSVKQGRKFLDQLAKSHTSFKKVPIMKYNNETYYLHYRQIFDAIKELLSNNDIFEHCNIPNWHHNKPDAKVLLCYLLILKAKTISEKKSRRFLLTKKTLFHKAFDVMMHPLLSYKDRGIDLQTNNGDIWCFPYISTLLEDLPENATQTLTYSINSKYPYHKCLISREDLNNLRLSNDEIELRTPTTMKNIVNQRLAYQYSIYDMNNIFWKYPQLDIYLATYPDRMHHLDLGLYKYQVIYTQEMLKNLCGQVAVDELDKCLATIPRFLGLKIFKHGLENIKRLTKLITDWITAFVKLFQHYSRSELKLPKLHNWVYHIINSIEEFGAINGYTTETYEFLHKDYVKNPYRSSNKRELMGQIINTVQHKTTLKYLIHQTKQKKSQKFTSLKGLLGKFALENFDEFFDSYKEKNSLASDALLALSQFLIVLNEFFDLDDNLTEEMIINNTIISWYSYTNMTASGDCVRAVSKYYNEPEFSNVSINMNVEEAEDYNTNEGTCFGKVLMLVNIVIKNYSSFDLVLVR
ncbi:hypothetical protein GLOIN_2v1470492 [Rhizophagus irregularis DAOM 181602=DAOM 197198]|nr:hypothetical protein GLOIN_2v1470492 [Rhizophagus irregularis DAOM 181602=DAOM 197198]